HAIAAWEPISSQYYPQLLKSVCAHYKIDMDTPVRKLPEEQMDKILYGSGKEIVHFHYVNDYGKERDYRVEFEGVLKNIVRRYKEVTSEFTRDKLEKYMIQQVGAICEGNRLNKEARAVLINGLHIDYVSDFLITEAKYFMETVDLT